MLDSTLNELIGYIYDAATDKLPWQDIGTKIAKQLDGTSMALFMSDPLAERIEPIAALGVRPETQQIYADHFVEHDLWLKSVHANRQFRQPTIGSEIVHNDTLARSVFYNEFLLPSCGAFHCLSGMKSLRGGGFVCMSSHRPREAADFSEMERHQMALLMPHVARAFEIRQRLSGESGLDGSTEIVQRLSQGVIQLGPTGVLIRANEKAESILQAHDGLMRSPLGVRAASPAANQRLQGLIHAAAQINNGGVGGLPGGHLQIDRPSGKRPYRCLVAPLGRDRVGVSLRRAAVVMFVVDPEERRTVDPSALQLIFGFTQAEARLVAALATGDALPKAALRLGISHNTARTLLARASVKAESNSQLELVQTILATMPNLIS